MKENNVQAKATILYVDDDEESLENFKTIFRRDYDVRLARSAHEAMAILERTPVQVLITDQRMPEMSGSELLVALADRYHGMLRFMLTGFGDFDSLVTAINEGRLQGLFFKPLDVDRLKERIEKGLNAHRPATENEERHASSQQSEKQAKIQLSEIEQVYAASPVGLVLVDKEGRIIRINQRLTEMTGLPAEVHIDRTIEEISPGLADDLKRIFRPEFSESGDPVTNVEIHGATVKEPDIIRDWLANYYPFRNADGEVIGVIGSVVEITGLRQVEKAAQEARLFAEKLLQTANVMIVGLDQYGCIQLINPMVQTVTGYSSDELIGQNWFELVVPKDIYPHAWDEFNRLLDGGLPPIFENPILTKEGVEHIISWSNSELKQNDTIVGTLSVGIDISKRKNAEKEKDLLSVQLRRAQKMEAIGTLAGGIAHDFNNILSPIIGYAEIIVSDAEHGTAIRDCAQEILKAGIRARDLTYQILTFSREKEQEKNPITIQPVIKEALKLLRASLPTTIKLNQRIDDKCGPIMGDTTQIYQVIMNLCTNAYQALKNQEGDIEVLVEEVLLSEEDQPQFIELTPGKFIRITVSDNGPGIEPNIMERIFDPYFTTKRMKSGTGLGLSVVHGIVKGHDGALKVYSEPGRGTSFNVYLPQLSDGSAKPTTAEDAPVAGGSESILLVDDETAIVRVVQCTLKRLGYHVTAFTDPREAVSEFNAQPKAYDLVITDMTMPHMTGLQLAKTIRTRNPEQPIVICTGFGDMVSRAKAAKTGVRQLVMKPLIQSELANTIRSVLDEKQD